MATFDPSIRKPKSGKGRPVIAILMPMVWGARDIVYSGVLRGLVEAGYELHLLVRELDPAFSDNPPSQEFSLAAGYERLHRPVRRRRIKGVSFLHRILRSAFSRRNHIRSYRMYRRWSNREGTTGQRIRSAAIEAAGLLGRPAFIFSGLVDLYLRLYAWEYELEPIRQQLARIAPDLVWSTANFEETYEPGYFLTARRLGIPILCTVLSFDNLTSKPVQFIYDHYFVWSDQMKSDLLRFYHQIRPERILTTGTTQFDFHHQPRFRWSREETLSTMGLSPDSRYFIYSCGPRALTPAEPELVVRLAVVMDRDPVLMNYRLVVRPHPLDDWSRWQQVGERSDRIVLSPAWRVKPDSAGWAVPPPDDLARLVSSLLYSEACINIASTIALDAAILDKPVIGIRFDREPDAPQEILYQEYDADHYRPLVESGGFRLALSWTQLAELMRDAIQCPQRDGAARKMMVAQVCGVVDGQSAVRVVQGVQGVIRGAGI